MSKQEWVDKFGETIGYLEQKKERRKAEIFDRAIEKANSEWEIEKILIQTEIDVLTRGLSAFLLLLK